jgi:two-component system chemotaxis response regulator CheB
MTKTSREKTINKDSIQAAAETVKRDRQEQIAGNRLGEPSIFTCPDCSGTLWQVHETELPVFRCHVGHVLTGEQLLASQSVAAEHAAWVTIRTLTDKMVLARLLAETARQKGIDAEAARFEALAGAAEQQAADFRRLWENSPAGV